MNDEDSPIFKLDKGTIREVVANLTKTDAVCTRMTSYYHVYWGDASPQAQELITPALGNKASFLFVGEPGFAKTPLCCILAMAVGRFYGDQEDCKVEPGFRTAADLDFFRCEPGHRAVPCIFDDGDLFDQHPKTLKAFFDTSQEEAMTRERWGASKFVLNQLRLAGENSYTEAQIPSDEEWAEANEGTQVIVNSRTTLKLWEMTKATFPTGISKANAFALFKRINIYLNTENHIYRRLAGSKSGVERFPIESHYITEDAGKVLFNAIRHQIYRPESIVSKLLHDEKQFFEQRLNRSGAAPMSSDSLNSELLDSQQPLEASGTKRSSSSSASGGSTSKRLRSSPDEIPKLVAKKPLTIVPAASLGELPGEMRGQAKQGRSDVIVCHSEDLPEIPAGMAEADILGSVQEEEEYATSWCRERDAAANEEKLATD